MHTMSDLSNIIITGRLVSIPYRDRYARESMALDEYLMGHPEEFQFPIGIDMHYCKNAALQTYSTV